MPALRMKGTVAALLLTAVSAAGDDKDRIDALDATAYDTQGANGTGSAQESGVRTLIFRSLESPTVESHPKSCPFTPNQTFPVVNLYLGAHLYSIAERASDSEVVNETVQDIGIASACGLLTFPVVASSAVPFYIEFTLGNGPDRGDTYVAQGECRPATFDVPKNGILLAGCVLRLLSGPQPFLGGAATSLSIFNLGRVADATTGSFWTIRASGGAQ
jgi:hypothetical protein